jgi:hypothetical protein
MQPGKTPRTIPLYRRIIREGWIRAVVRSDMVRTSTNANTQIRVSVSPSLLPRRTALRHEDDQKIMFLLGPLLGDDYATF